MKTEDMIKYGALLLGAYLLYRWITSQSTTPAVTETETKKLPPADTNVPVTTEPKLPTQLDIYNAALLDTHASRTGNLMFDGHTWNWYRAVAAREAGWSEEEIARRAQADLGPRMGDSMTAVQYHALLKEKGLDKRPAGK